MEFSAVFPIREQCLYLDHAALAPLPQPVVLAMEAALNQHQRDGFWAARELNQVDHKVRTLLAQVVGCEPNDVSLYPDSSTALFALLAGLDVPKGTRVWLATDDPDGVQPLARFLERMGRPPSLVVSARWEHLPRVLAAERPQGALICLPWVDDAGWVGELDRWMPELKEASCTVILDASHAVPCRPERFAELGADALLLPSHLWLLGPRGAAAAITTPELRKRWHPLLPSARKPLMDGDRDAACFEGHGVSPVLLAGWAAGLELLLGEGLPTIRNRIFAHQRTLTSYLLELGWALGSPGAAHPVAGIVLARHPFFPAEEVQRRLQARHVRVGTFGGWVRFSPHFYTTLAELSALQKILASL